MKLFGISQNIKGVLVVKKVKLDKKSNWLDVATERDLAGKVIKTEKREYVKSANHLDFHKLLCSFLSKTKGANPHECPHALYDEYAKFLYSWGDSKPFKSKNFDESKYIKYLDLWDLTVRPVISNLT